MELVRLGGTMARHYATDDITDYSGEPTRRLKPSVRLTGRARVVFAQTVANCAVEHFRVSDSPLLETYCQACAIAETAAAKLTEQGAVAGDKQSAWFLVFQGATKSMTNLALRLRLSPQARGPRAPKKVAAPMSFYDEMSSFGEEDGDEDGAEAKPS
jgi:phage terminase small subunit